MDMNTPVPDGKRCEQCGQPLVWAGSGARLDGEPEHMREGIYTCPGTCDEDWFYAPATGRWRKHSAKA